MGNKRTKRLIACLLLFTVLTLAVAGLSGHAEAYPDISNLDSNYYLPDNRQFFHRPDGGFALASTNSSGRTMVTLLDASGNVDESQGAATYNLSFVYEKAFACGEFLYLAGQGLNASHSVELFRVGLISPSRVYNNIVNVSCDLSRGFSADADGNIFLVTVPYGSELSSSSPFWVYAFQADSYGASCSGTPVPNSPSSSAPSETPSSAPSSGSSSAAPGSSQESSAPSSTPASQPEAKPYFFSGPITVESLQQQLDTDGRGAKVRVTGVNGNLLATGSVGTGSIVEVLLNGQAESRIKAVVPGDLTGTGSVTEQDSRILYEHVTNLSGLSGLYFQAADINKNGKVDPGDMLKIKSMIK